MMLTKSEILEKADVSLDLSMFNTESLEELNKMFGGNYVEHFKRTSDYIEQGVNLFLSAVGRKVTVWNNGKCRETTVIKIEYDREKDYYVLLFEDKGFFSFRNGGFSSLGRYGEYYGISNNPDKKSGIRFINKE